MSESDPVGIFLVYSGSGGVRLLFRYPYDTEDSHQVFGKCTRTHCCLLSPTKYWPRRGQPSIYFPIGDHVNVSWCCSHTNASGVISTSHIVASHITKLLLSFRQILQFRFWDNPQGRIPPWKVTKTRPFLSMCYGDPSATEVPPCCETATKKLTFSTTSVLLLLNMPLSLSRATIFRRQKNPRRVYRPKIAGILFVCNEPEGKYYTVP